MPCINNESVAHIKALIIMSLLDLNSSNHNVLFPDETCVVREDVPIAKWREHVMRNHADGDLLFSQDYDVSEHNVLILNVRVNIMY